LLTRLFSFWFLSSLATTTTRLATEVKEAVDADPLSGPRSDRAKHFVGIEFEVALEHMLRERGELMSCILNGAHGKCYG
jgi:hypothetical protein